MSASSFLTASTVSARRRCCARPDRSSSPALRRFPLPPLPVGGRSRDRFGAPMRHGGRGETGVQLDFAAPAFVRHGPAPETNGPPSRCGGSVRRAPLRARETAAAGRRACWPLHRAVRSPPCGRCFARPQRCSPDRPAAPARRAIGFRRRTMADERRRGKIQFTPGSRRARAASARRTDPGCGPRRGAAAMGTYVALANWTIRACATSATAETARCREEAARRHGREREIVLHDHHGTTWC